MQKTHLEILVGLFFLAGFVAFGWLALRLGEVPWIAEQRSYTIQAEFNNISGIAKGAMIRIAGVDVGRVTSLRLGEDNLALVSLQVDRAVRIPKDSIASVKSQGIIGDKFIQITLGGDEQVFKPGEVLRETESAVDIESLISKFAFGQVK